MQGEITIVPQTTVKGKQHLRTLRHRLARRPALVYNNGRTERALRTGRETMAYQALYRQWRPMTFAQVVGQEAVVRTLRRQMKVTVVESNL